jgi:hypothetical protein
MDDNSLWNSPNIDDVHSKIKNRLEEDEFLLESKVPFSLALMVVRNPLTRVLSAWLDKRQDPSFRRFFDSHPGATDSFAKFIEAITPEVRQHRASRFWAQQSDQCMLRYGAQYDIYLKTECRTLWGPGLFEHKMMTQWTNSGWGPDGSEPFVPDDRLRYFQNVSRPLGDAPATQTKATSRHNLNTGASALSTLCKYYTRKLFWDVSALYVEDIKRFGYKEDCLRIATHCGY